MKYTKYRTYLGNWQYHSLQMENHANCLCSEAKATAGHRHYNCQPYYSTTTPDSRDMKFWGWQRLIQAKGPVFHSVSTKFSNLGPPQELDSDANTSQEESPTCIKNWSIRNQINPSWESMFSSSSCREIAKYSVEKLGTAFKFGHHVTEGVDTIITSLLSPMCLSVNQ